MTKINIGRLFDMNKALSTKAGQDLTDMIQFLQQAFDQLLRTVKGGITIEDNLNGASQLIQVTHGSRATIGVLKAPKHVFPTKLLGPTVGDTQTEPLPQIAWFMNSQNQLVVVPYFRTANTSKTYSLQLVILYP